jgi:ABC-2 type transport system permease protein
MTDVLRSEWTKIRSVRSTVWLLIGGVLSMVGFAILIALAEIANNETGDPASTGLAGTPIAALLMAVLGVVVISGEYRTGMIRTTLLAVPRRVRVFAVMLPATFAGFFAAQVLFGDQAASLADPGVLRAVVGSALYITAGALFGLGLGAAIRHTAGGIVAVFLSLMLLPQMSGLLPGEWGYQVHRFFTTNAGQQVAFISTQPGQLGPWQGFAVYCAWVAAALVAAAVLLRRRDA